jgi:hypothetical protein
MNILKGKDPKTIFGEPFINKILAGIKVKNYNKQVTKAKEE